MGALQKTLSHRIAPLVFYLDNPVVTGPLSKNLIVRCI